jgi:hypothetical protein
MRDDTERLLRDAGWCPERSQDVSAVCSLLEARGYSVGGIVEMFLREFTGITINYTRSGHPDSIWFDAQRASEMADPEWISYYEIRTKTSLTPIGYSNHDHLMLMQSGEGGFYGAFDEFLCALSRKSYEMIDILVNQVREPLV